MNSRTNRRFLSLITVICLLAGMVLPCFAASSGNATSGDVIVLLNNDFEDNTSIENGGEIVNYSGINKVSGSDNSYVNLPTVGSDDEYFSYVIGNYLPESGSVVIQFDFMSTASISSGNLLAVYPNSATNGTTYGEQSLLMGNSGTRRLKVPKTTTSCGSTTQSSENLSYSSGTWYTVAFVYTFESKSAGTVTSYFGTKGGTLEQKAESSITYKNTPEDVRPNGIRIRRVAAAWNMDNIKIYTSNTTDAATALNVTIADSDRGALYNYAAAPDIDVSKYLGNAFFKVNVENALNSNNQRVTGIAAPFIYNGGIYIPASSLTTVIGSAPAGGTQSVNGISAVELNDIGTAYSGYHAEYNSMGLIVVTSSSDTVFVEGADLTLIPVMQRFLFDNVTSDVTNANSFSVNNMTASDHPYLYADSATFDALHEIYLSGGESDPTLYSYIKNRVDNGYSIYSRYNLAKSNDYTGFNTTVGIVAGQQSSLDQIPFTSNEMGGYDVGGRLGQAANNNENILALAFAYQMTRDENLARLAYDYAITMGKWEHWGPGHFLNVADAMSPYAVAYDWLYDAWTELGFDVEAIELILFTHGLVPAFLSINTSDYSKLPWGSPPVTGGWNFYNRENNWNAVCSAGTTVAALALVNSTTATSGVQIDIAVNGTYSADVPFTNYPTGNTSVHNGYSTYQDYAEFIINQGLYNLPRYGLQQYITDGSYIESNGYWSYGTNNIYEMVAALVSCTDGGDWGLLDAWGMDRTVYYAINTMSSDGNSFNYHDSNTVSAQDTSWFMFLGSEYGMGDTTLAGIRKNFNANLSQSPSYYDCIYYMSDEEIGDWDFPDLQYYMEGIDGYVVRDSWDKNEGTLYAGMIGNTNNLGHGQIDSGSFVYYNKGTRWFCDIGTEEYNAAGFWGSTTRYAYYSMGGEGNNNLIITSEQSLLKYGQTQSGFGELCEHGNNEYGAYAVIDNTSVYGGLANDAKRGLLLTNSRKTTVIQDEASFNKAVDLAWIGHIQSGVQTVLSVDGTIAYMYDGKTVMRVKLIDNNNSGLTFRIGNAADEEDRLLNVTLGNNYSVSNGGEPQKDYSSYERLIIEAKGVTSFNVAIVIEELIPGETNASTFGYRWTDISDWVPEKEQSSQASPSESKVATVTLTPKPTDGEDEVKPDTPIVDIFGVFDAPAAALVMSVVNESNAVTESTTMIAGSFDELEDIIAVYGMDNIITIVLHESNESSISIEAPCTVDLNGNKLLATSPYYVCTVGDDSLEFHSGSITVKWHLSNGSTVNQLYYNTTSAVYSGTIADGTTITEENNGDGTYSYYTTGNAWALSPSTSGNYAKQASAEDMIVTSENTDFYQTRKKYGGVMVTVNGSTITGYQTVDEKTFYSILNTRCDRISVTNNFDITSTSTDGSISQAGNIYFNGYYITYYSTVTSDHFLQTSNSAGNKIEFFGPGGVDNRALASNAWFKNGVGETNFYNVDFISTYTLIDYRAGKGGLYNCNITINARCSAVSIHNRNNINKDESTYPDLTVSGCVFNLPYIVGGTNVFTLINNSRIELCDGTTVNVASGGTLIRHQAMTMSDATDFDWDNCDAAMQARLGEVYHNCEKLADSSSANPDSNKQESDKARLLTRTYYVEGAAFKTDPSSDSTIRILDGNFVARQNNIALPYVLVSDNYANVTWSYNGASIKENWLAGETPSISDAANKFGIEDDKMLIFNTSAVSNGETPTYTGVLLDKFGLKVNMSLQEDFNLNFFVEKKGEMTFVIDGVAVTPDTSSMPGYYKVAKTGINPANAGKAVKLEVTYNGNTLTKWISPIDYANNILSGENFNETEKKLMANVVKYIDAAYVIKGYNTGETISEYTAISSIYNTYKKYATVAVVDRQAVDLSGITDALGGAQLNLESAPKFRFNLKEDYNGEVSFTYTASDGSRKTATYAVVNGLCGGKSYIEIGFKAYFMTEDIEITTAKGTATYNLANYYYYEINESGTLANLINALYAYCETARIYRDSAN